MTDMVGANATGASAMAALDVDLHQLLQKAIKSYGPGLLLTINANLSYPLLSPPASDAVLLLQRIWTSDALHYPVSGRKLKSLTTWTQHLLVEGQAVITEGRAQIAQHFSDHATITGMGLHSVINMPLCDEAGRCFASINLLSPMPVWPDSIRSNMQMWCRDAMPAVRRYCEILRSSTLT